MLQSQIPSPFGDNSQGHNIVPFFFFFFEYSENHPHGQPTSEGSTAAFAYFLFQKDSVVC